MNHLTIREKFFSFFTERRHTKVPSSSLIPAQDPTLLFANAGMNQFKDLFLGNETRSYKEAVSIQKCIRAGGKHNDLENVGFTKRHLTFFEMMGNFSFGAYFKREAIAYAWEFLTQRMGLDPKNLYASVYRLDDEAYTIWHKDIGLPSQRIVRLGETDNFWQMGDTGPCGPCSEIYVDRGIAFGCGTSSCAPGCSCDRFLEIWNLVFMQYNRQSDGKDIPLQQTGVDTGMGLERLCTIVQQKDSVFEIDLFSELIHHLEELSGRSYSTSVPATKAAFHVLVDHIRSAGFSIADGGLPSHEGRGYVIRKIIRRAALFSQKLGDIHYFSLLVPSLIKQMGFIYPELIAHQDHITKVIEQETDKFGHNLAHGQTIFAKFAETAGGAITGQQAFKLYDTYGFPLELTKVLAHEEGLTVDIEGFDKEMEQQRTKSGKKHHANLAPTTITTTFTGYNELTTSTPIKALLINNEEVEVVPQGERCWIITSQSPFYVEGGGQVSDQGFLIKDNIEIPILQIKRIGMAIAHEVDALITLQQNDVIVLSVNRVARLDTMKNHTATHLLQSALMKILGSTVRQAGSLVAPDYLRFDFTYQEPITQESLDAVEALVNQKIMDNIPLITTITNYQDALQRNVIAFFGEKYNPESVRVVEIPGFSAELCGGTHVRATGDIGCFKIIELTSLSAGSRRIVAVTGPKAFQLFQDSFDTVKKLSQEFKVKTAEVVDAVKKQREHAKTLQTEIKTLKKELLAYQIPTWLSAIEKIGTMPFLYKALKDKSAEELKDIALQLEHKSPGFYFLTSSTPTNATFVIYYSALYSTMLSLVDLRNFLQEQGLRSGGSNNLLQGGSSFIAPHTIEQIKEWLHKRLS